MRLAPSSAPAFERVGDHRQIAGERTEHVLDEERVGVIDDLLLGAETAQPTGRELVVRGQGAHVLHRRLTVAHLDVLEVLERGLDDTLQRHGELRFDLGREGAGCLEQLGGRAPTWGWAGRRSAARRAGTGAPAGPPTAGWCG